ncbi:MAG TPA: hypothetical protein VGQ00_01600 [Candidatus Norongarragalinales archaeon]|jgi:hypothetical protein|nr:hypothetical protein [Candidatus Norongarragalinales archaeon]
MDKIEEEVLKTLAKKYDFVPGRLKEVGDFLKQMQDYTHYVATSQYFSEVLNKKVALLTLDIDSLALRVEVLRMLENMLYAEAEKATFRKDPIALDKKKVENLKAEMKDVEKALTDTSSQAIALTKMIREEFKTKNGTT